MYPCYKDFFYPITFPSLKFRGALSANVKSIIRLLFAFAKGTRMEREYGTRNVNVSTFCCFIVCSFNVRVFKICLEELPDFMSYRVAPIESYLAQIKLDPFI